jgi:predicted house-cleaning noncanonical NTP pyrophosphatase (MazG superfamily)
MADRKRLVKLVRDDVGQFGNGSVVYESLDGGEDHAILLRQKLLEEVGEYLIDPSIGELADVLQCVCDLADVDLGVTVAALDRERIEKLNERGGFTGGTGMYVFSSAPDRHEGSKLLRAAAQAEAGDGA